jgi:hypothetical protein
MMPSCTTSSTHSSSVSPVSYTTWHARLFSCAPQPPPALSHPLTFTLSWRALLSKREPP